MCVDMSDDTTGLSDEFVTWARTVKVSKRAGKAREMLLDRGTVTTGELSAAGYDHPPRAIRDLKDAGFALESESVTIDGRRMARYTLLDTITADYAVRKPIPLTFRKALFAAHDHRCAVCGGEFITRMLQADHRVPFHIGGDPDPMTIPDFMPLCGSDNRAKSMSCETCPNWTVRDVETCQTCYWHDTDDYEHVATESERRVTFVLRGDDVERFDQLREDAERRGSSVVDEIIERL